MTKRPRAWGKRDRQAADPLFAAELTLVGHCIDVAAVTRALLELPTWQRRLLRLAQRERFSLTDLDRLTVLAFLHDVGKAGAGFYSKALTEAQQQGWLRQARAGRAAQGHTRVVAALLDLEEPAIEQHRIALGLDEIARWGGTDRTAGQVPMLDLWLAAVSHHGDPICHDVLAASTPPGKATWLYPVAGYSPLNGLAELGQAARELWPLAFDDPRPFGPPTPGLTHAFAGLVSLADWIGSNTEPKSFPYGLGGTQDTSRWRVALPRARQVLRDLRIDVEDIRAALRAPAPRFADVFGPSLRWP
jgi:CRISPR-associated endonuclease/helicase Cas3